MDEMILQIVNELQIELKDDTEFDIDVLLLKVTDAARDVRSARRYPKSYSEDRIIADLTGYYSVIKSVARYDYNMIGAEGQTSNTENGVSRTWMRREKLFAEVTPLCRFQRGEDMRVVKRNKQKMFYALYSGSQTVYERDEDGNIIYIEVDGEQVPVEIGTMEASYSEPVEFCANIASNLSQVRMASWGVDQSSIYSEITCDKGYLPIDIGTIIWRESTITYEDEENKIPKQSSCDYTVTGKMTEGLTEDRFLLQRNTSDSGVK